MLLNSVSAAKIDAQLMSSKYGYTLHQLMELAGFSVAQAINREYGKNAISSAKNNILIVVGPGNNGGDGLVAARHLKLFGWNPVVYYPTFDKSIQKQSFYLDLCKQLEELFKIEIVKKKIVSHNTNTDIDKAQLNFFHDFHYIVDCVFGFSFKPPIKPESTFGSIIEDMIALSDDPSHHNKIISVDIPSGWDVDMGPIITAPYLKPSMLISLTYPKQCCEHLPKDTVHYCGGRFISNMFAAEFGFPPIEYKEELQVYKFSPGPMS